VEIKALNRLLLVLCMVSAVLLAVSIYLWQNSEQRLKALQVQMKDRTSVLEKQVKNIKDKCTSPWDEDLNGTPRPCGKKWRRWCQQGCTSGALEVAPDWMKK